jgi:stearoyl-CoA desaturase (delta-9 desaturase)
MTTTSFGKVTLPKPDASELDIPGTDFDTELPSWLDDKPRSLAVDRVLAAIVTFAPPIAFAVALYLHFSGIAPITSIELTLWLVLHLLALTGVELGFHRLFSHHSYKASRGVKIGMAVLGSLAFQGPPIWWAATHRKHHRYSDRPGDPHSTYVMPHDGATYNKGLFQLLRGVLHSHIGWIWVAASMRPVGWGSYVRNLYRDKDLYRVHLLYPYILASGFVVPAVIGGLLHGTWMGVLTGFLWGGFVRIFFMNHLTYWTVNSLAHSVGARPYVTADQSTNSVPILLAIPTLGQSYHNNHHAFPYSARMTHEWYQIDLGLGILKVLELFGQVSDMKAPTREAIEKKRNLTKKRTLKTATPNNQG